MMRYSHIAARLFNTPLLLLPEYGHVVTTVLADRLGVEPVVAADTVERYKRPNFSTQIDRQNGVAIVPIVGGTVHRQDFFAAESGGQSYTSIHAKLTDLADDSSVRGILLDMDTPGGEVGGLQELASYMAEIAKEKPIWALANTAAASAGYWLMTSANRLLAAPGARVGSVGVYTAHVDVSKQMDKRGIVHTFIYAGAKKIDGNPYEALPESVRADMQSRVDRLWNKFADHVASRRDLTREQVQGLEAGVFDPEEAVDLGLVDGIATLGQAVSDFAAFLNRPKYVQGQVIGDAMSDNRLIHSAADLTDAVATARADENKKVRATVAEEVRKAVTGEFLAAFAALFPASPRAALFAEALNEGASVSLAQKMALRVEDPKETVEKIVEKAPAHATVADVDRMVRAHTPSVGAEESPAGAGDPNDARAKRLAELRSAARTYSVSAGYSARLRA